MTRHPIEQFVESIVIGSSAADVIYGMSSLKRGRPFAEEEREALEATRDDLNQMLDIDISSRNLIGENRLDRSRRLQMWELVGQGRTVEEQQAYLERLRDGVEEALAGAEWNEDMEEVRKFFGDFHKYELGRCW